MPTYPLSASHPASQASPHQPHAQVFLWPVGLLAMSIPAAIIAGFNPSRFTLGLYFGGAH